MKKHKFSYTVEQLLPYIDWSYFFHAWGIAPRESDSEKAREVQHDAESLLHELRDADAATALFALCDARSCSDDIIIENKTLPLLRQQHTRAGEPNLCLSDFISPRGDKIGLFATSVSPLFAETGKDDTYRSLLTQTIASRLAEAAATLLHSDVRRRAELWGYAPDESLTPQELNAEKYQGIRPAVGYPSLPDQSVIFIIDKLLGLNEAGIALTPNGAMIPHASVCGLMLAHPAARYFSVGKISDEQLHDYARRRSLPLDYLHRFLYKNIQN